MSMTRKLITVVGMSLVAGSVSTSAYAVSKQTAATAQADVARLIRRMDKDMNGVVSKDEFLQFMGQTFDRLDVNRSGQLERHEILPLLSGSWDRIHDPRENPSD